MLSLPESLPNEADGHELNELSISIAILLKCLSPQLGFKLTKESDCSVLTTSALFFSRSWHSVSTNDKRQRRKESEISFLCSKGVTIQNKNGDKKKV